MKLAIISHTEHFYNDYSQIVGWGPTIREINYLLEVFDEIWHVAVLIEGAASPSALSYCSDKIHFVPIKPFGGKSITQKIGILWKAPSVIRTVKKTLREVDWWQFRAPTGIGVFLIPYLSLFAKKPGWFKYAGNWVQQNPPLGYAWQRLWLKRMQRRKVTINGQWSNQPKHCLSFENPCLSDNEREIGKNVLLKKEYKKLLNFCFLGNLEKYKGVYRILTTLERIRKHSKIGKIHFIGDGSAREELQEKSIDLSVSIHFHGYLNRIDLVNIIEQCHVLLLPSDSEGFPKVIAECANYGLIPIVSDVSCIGQYIKSYKNGFLIEASLLDHHGLTKEIENLLEVKNLKRIALSANEIVGQFTFSHYNNRIKKEILKEN